jgi:hypothetical protein
MFHKGRQKYEKMGGLGGRDDDSAVSN